MGALARELQGVASRLLEQQMGLRVSRVRRWAPSVPHATLPDGPRARVVSGPAATFRSPPMPPARGLRWERATFLWRPEGLELRVPHSLDHGAMAAFATDSVWETGGLPGVRREIWGDWLALASPTLLDDLDPEELRRSLDAAVSRALAASGGEPARLQDFLRRLRGHAPRGPDMPPSP